MSETNDWMKAYLSEAWQGAGPDVREEPLRRTLMEFLDVLDSIDRLIAAKADDDTCCTSDESTHPWFFIRRQLLGAFVRAGVEFIETRNCQFDPAIHEAIATIESRDHPPNLIVEEFARGCSLHGVLLRRAKVKVGLPPAEPHTNRSSLCPTSE